jgi:diguanylate cyclase (GGDEF)-like protein
MKLQARVILILGVAWLLMLVVVVADSKLFISKNYEQLERSIISGEVEDVKRALRHLESSLTLYTVAWADWDDAYKFVVTKNKEFITSNFVPGTFTSSHINFFLFYTTTGQFFEGRQFDLTKNEFVPVSPSLLAYLSNNKSFILHDSINSKRQGLLDTSDGLILMSSLPVLTGNSEGPIRGTVLMGYYLTDEFFNNLSEIVGKKVHFYNLKSDLAKPEVSAVYNHLLKNVGSYIAFRSKKNADAYIFITDIHQQPVGILQITVPRDIYLQGLATTHHYLFILISLGIVTLIFLWYLIKIFVLNKIINVNKQVQYISQHNRFDKTIYVTGDDEISNLVNVINKMMRLINHSHLQLTYMAKHDPLTQLPNRRCFYDLLEQAIEEAKRDKKYLAVIFIDLDKFKQVNDKHGHNAGDKVLQIMASRLKHAIRQTDIIGHQSGDEFIVCLKNIHNTSDVRRLVDSMLTSISLKFNIYGNEIDLHFSAGVSIYPDDGTTVEQLIQSADKAMYIAKNQQGNAYQMYGEMVKLEPRY